MAWDTTDTIEHASVAAIPSSHQRILRSTLSNVGSITLTSARAYFVYVGKTTREITTARIAYFVATVADAGTPAEVGLFSSPSAPNRSSQVLTKIAAAAASGLTALKTQTTTLVATIPAGTHLWVAIRDASVTTRVSLRGLGFDLLDGSCLITSSATALTSGTTYTGTVPTDATTATSPDLSATLD